MRKVLKTAEKPINNRLIYHVVAITLIAIFLWGVGSVESQENQCAIICEPTMPDRPAEFCSITCPAGSVANCFCVVDFPVCECETSVGLISFTAVAGADGSITLSWETGTEIDNAGFNLFRTSTQGGPYVKITDPLIPARGAEVFGASYSFIDKPGEGTFYYMLEDVDTSGQGTLHGPVQVKVGVVQPQR
jgi:hypothetical protein